jgi:hypothetical protein
VACILGYFLLPLNLLYSNSVFSELRGFPHSHVSAASAPFKLSCALTIGALWDTSKYKKVYLSFTILVSFILVTYPDRIGLVNTVPTVGTVASG